jgi:phosphate transport system substrate-binding protein
MFKNLLAAVTLVGLLWPGPVSGQQVDPKLQSYKPVNGISGSLKSVGSDSMNNLMALWTEGFRKMYPNVTIEVEGKGSTTAPPALIAGTADFGPMSREMKGAEIDGFEKKYGYKPTLLGAGIDMLAVYVHKDNPIESLTLPQVDAIFSSTRALGASKDIRTWGGAGLKGPWASQPVSLYGRNSASGTYGYFKEHALGKGDFKNLVAEQPGSSAVVQSVARDKNGIGYSGIGYKTANVRAVALAIDADAEPIPAEPEYAYSGDYPLSRLLYIYVNYKPGSQLPPLQREFARYVYSKQGQQDVVKDGYYPVTAAMANKYLSSLGISGSQPKSAGKQSPEKKAAPGAASKKTATSVKPSATATGKTD